MGGTTKPTSIDELEKTAWQWVIDSLLKSLLRTGIWRGLRHGVAVYSSNAN